MIKESQEVDLITQRYPEFFRDEQTWLSNGAPRGPLCERGLQIMSEREAYPEYSL